VVTNTSVSSEQTSCHVSLMGEQFAMETSAGRWCIGDWIFGGFMRGSLVIGHDGSYMPHLANNARACASVIYCSHTDQFTDVTWVEKSRKQAANNYRAEILGGCSTQLIIKATIKGRNLVGHHTPTVGCNNIGVVRHG